MRETNESQLEMLDCDEAWENFCDDGFVLNEDKNKPECSENLEIPKCSEIYISTKTKISYLDRPIDLEAAFWKVKVNSYFQPKDGVIKKQMKLNFKTEKDVEIFKEKLKDYKYYNEHIITSIRNPEGKVKFKDTRKITIGISKKDILSYRCKVKSAFYNCFVLILRLLDDDNSYKECHVKIFNTGKLELPGIQSEKFLVKILDNVVSILRHDCGLDVNYLRERNETVLINSNFNCGYFIDREKLVDILKYKYHFETSYDPCSYPGIMSKFYYDSEKNEQTGIKPNNYVKNKSGFYQVSFMIFRTGSVLIVGKCDDKALYKIYDVLKNILSIEYKNVFQPQNKLFNLEKSEKKKKIRKKTITIIQNQVNC